MKLLKKITKLGVQIVTTPIDVAKDVITMAGVCTEQEKPYTIQKIEKIGNDIDNFQ